jgi:hypothetical protein
MTSEPDETPPTKPDAISPDDRLSLAGHDPEDVLRALLKVDPESEPVSDERGSDGRPNRAESSSRPKRHRQR